MTRLGDAMSVLMGAKALPSNAPAPDIHGVTGNPGRRVSNLKASRYSQAYGGTDAIDTVFECVNLYATIGSQAEHYFKKNDVRAVSNPRSPEYKNKGYTTAPPELVELFARPNRAMDYSELIQLSIIDLLLCGEFIWLKNQSNALGQPKEVYRVPPQFIDVIPGKVLPDHYEYKVPGAGEPQRWATEDVVHVKLPNPHDPWRGLGVIAASPRMFDIAIAVDDAIAQYYEQGTRLSGVLESERSITDNTWEKVKRQFFNLYSGGRNAFRVAALERGLTFKPISGTAEQADFGAAQDKAALRVGKAFNVPMALLGDMGGSIDRQAVREAQRIFDNKVMRPFLDSLQQRVTHQLLYPADQWTDYEWCIEYEYVLPLEDRIAMGEKLEGMPIRVWELRQFLGYPPLGDERDEMLLTDPGKAVPAPGGADPTAPTTAGVGLPATGGTASYPSGVMGRTGESQAQKAVERTLREAMSKLPPMEV